MTKLFFMLHILNGIWNVTVTIQFNDRIMQNIEIRFWKNKIVHISNSFDWSWLMACIQYVCMYVRWNFRIEYLLLPSIYAHPFIWRTKNCEATDSTVFSFCYSSFSLVVFFLFFISIYAPSERKFYRTIASLLRERRNMWAKDPLVLRKFIGIPRQILILDILTFNAKRIFHVEI